MDRGPARATDPAVRPLPPHQLAVPPQQRRRGDEEDDPAVAWNDPTGRCEEDPVGGPELRWAGLSLEYMKLAAQDQDLEVLGSVVAAHDDETGERAEDEVRQKQHRRMLEAV